MHQDPDSLQSRSFGKIKERFARDVKIPDGAIFGEPANDGKSGGTLGIPDFFLTSYPVNHQPYPMPEMCIRDSFRVIRLDLPAFGLTGPATDADYSIDYYVDFLDHFLTALDVQESYIAGNSLGGGITWLYAAKYPEKVKKIILLDAAGYRAEMPSIEKLASPDTVRSVIRYITPRYAIHFLVKQVYGENEKVTDETVSRYHRLLLREGNREVMFRVLDKIQDRENEDVKQLLNGIEVPALIIWGEKDAWIPLEPVSYTHLDVYKRQDHRPERGDRGMVPQKINYLERQVEQYDALRIIIKSQP